MRADGSDVAFLPAYRLLAVYVNSIENRFVMYRRGSMSGLKREKRGTKRRLFNANGF